MLETFECKFLRVGSHVAVFRYAYACMPYVAMSNSLQRMIRVGYTLDTTLLNICNCCICLNDYLPKHTLELPVHSSDVFCIFVVLFDLPSLLICNCHVSGSGLPLYYLTCIHFTQKRLAALLLAYSQCVLFTHKRLAALTAILSLYLLPSFGIDALFSLSQHFHLSIHAIIFALALT